MRTPARSATSPTRQRGIKHNPSLALRAGEVLFATVYLSLTGSRGHLLEEVPGSVRRAVIDEDDLFLELDCLHALKQCLDCCALVIHRNDDGDLHDWSRGHSSIVAKPPSAPSNDHACQQD